MDKDKVFDFYEKMYLKELDEMNAILSRFPILIAGAALIINAYIFIFNFDRFKNLNNYWQITMSILIAIAVSGLLFCLFKAFKSNLYELTPDLETLEKKKKEYQEYEINIKSNNLLSDDDHQQKEEKAEDLFQEDIQNKFVKATTINRKHNTSRREWFHQALRLIWINLLLCITIPIIVTIINIWSPCMAEEKKNPTPVSRPAPTETVAVRNNIPGTEHMSIIIKEDKRPTRPTPKNDDKK